MSSFAQRIIAWQRLHGRHDLPWQAADAYGVWLSEIMLQQTQVATVIPYYQRFVGSFPDIAALAAASEDAVLAHWSGLGYYARARNLQRAARLIMQRHDGIFPREFEDIIALPGIGRSTAAAIGALAFHQHRAILDGNVKRVLARYCAIEGHTGGRKIETQLWQQAEALLPAPSRLPAGEIAGNLAVVVGQPGRMAGSSSRFRERGGSNDSIATYTQGLMDLGATICTRSKPGCDICPAREDCASYRNGRVAQLPTPRPRKALPERRSTFLLLRHGHDILLEKRPGSGIWGGLWCPPQMETAENISAYCMQHFGVDAVQVRTLPEFPHTFTHFKLHIVPLLIQVRCKPMQMNESGWIWLDVGEALRAAIPKPVRRLLADAMPD